MTFGFGIGWSNIFALPFAVSIDTDDDGDRWIAVHIGPLLLELMWERP